MPEETNPQSEYHLPVCPYLKLVMDDSVKYGFPDEANYCYRPQKARPVALAYQKQVCVNGPYRDCLMYSPEWDSMVPEDVNRGPAMTASWFNFRLMGIIVLVIAFFIVGALRMQVIQAALSGSTITPTVMVLHSPSPRTARTLTPAPTANVTRILTTIATDIPFEIETLATDIGGISHLVDSSLSPLPTASHRQ